MGWSAIRGVSPERGYCKMKRDVDIVLSDIWLWIAHCTLPPM